MSRLLVTIKKTGNTCRVDLPGCIRKDFPSHNRSGVLLKFLPLLFTQIVLLFSCRGSPSENQHYRLDAHMEETAAAKPCKTDSFTAAFYNVENCFDFEYDSTEYPEYIPGNSSWTREIQLVKINNMAEVISAIKPDIIGLCEVEDEDALEDLKRGLQRYGVSYKYNASGCGQTRSATCPMLLSRFPVCNVLTHHINLPGKSLTREILEADVQVCNRMLKIFVNHWPSKLHPESHRLKAAETLAARLKELPSACEYILIGDFNTDYNEFQTFSSFKLNDTDGKTGMNTVLGTTIYRNGSVGYILENDLHNSNSLHHFDPWIGIEENYRMSMVFRGNNQTPDHILVPGTLLDSTGISYIDKSFRPFTWNGKLLKDGRPYRWQIKWVKKQKMHLGRGYSDHLPVVAGFRMGPYKADTSGATNNKMSIPEPVMAGNQKTIKSAGFEYSTDGWIACKDAVIVQRDSTVVKGGLFSLCISAPALKSNVTVARVHLKKKKSGKALNGLYCKGNGKFSFRIRNGEAAWSYYNAPEFKASKSARYKEVDFRDWIRVNVSGECPAAEDVELELRAGKEVPLKLWIDEIY